VLLCHRGSGVSSVTVIIIIKSLVKFFSSYSLMDVLYFFFFHYLKCSFKLRYSIIAAKFISECLQLNFISECPFIF